MRDVISPRPHHLLLSDFLILSHLSKCEVISHYGFLFFSFFFIMVLISVSLIDDVEHLFKGLSATCISSMETSLFRPFAYCFVICVFLPLSC